MKKRHNPRIISYERLIDNIEQKAREEEADDIILADRKQRD
jgi:hypothetical protein